MVSIFKLCSSAILMSLFFWGCQQPKTKHDIENASLEIIDLSQKQLRLYNTYKNSDSLVRQKIFRDSLYIPYQNLWNGYVGNAETFDLVAYHYGVKQLSALNKKNKQFYSGNQSETLWQKFSEIKNNMSSLTGYNPKGEWYLIYGPALANLGTGGNGIMFIDFAHPTNTDLEAVINWFPHELNHQIHDNQSKDKTHNVLSRCISEGFAVYVNKLYWNTYGNNPNYTLAMSLSWTEEELVIAENEWDFILHTFEKVYLSEDKEAIGLFGARNKKIKTNLPSAIGYYIGYKIIENYCSIYGKDAWKSIYKMSNEEILKLSKTLKH